MNKYTKPPLKILGVLTLLPLFLSCILAWWSTAGRLEYIHYPGAEMESGEECCNWELAVNNNGGMLTVSRRFLVAESDTERIIQWYKDRGWSRFGELLRFPGIELGPIRLESGKVFNLGEPDRQKLLIVQTITYRYSFTLNTEP